MVLTWEICNMQPREWWRFQRCPQVCIICICSLRHLTIFCQHFWQFCINIFNDSWFAGKLVEGTNCSEREINERKTEPIDWSLQPPSSRAPPPPHPSTWQPCRLSIFAPMLSSQVWTWLGRSSSDIWGLQAAEQFLSPCWEDGNQKLMRIVKPSFDFWSKFYFHFLNKIRSIRSAKSCNWKAKCESTNV